MDFSGNKPIYLQIADLIMQSILTGEIDEGERISSVRDFATEIEVNPNTVMRAYQYLQDEEIIFNKRGIGFFVAKKARVKSSQLTKNYFVENHLPEFFKVMDLLGMQFSEVEELYNKRRKTK